MPLTNHFLWRLGIRIRISPVNLGLGIPLSSWDWEYPCHLGIGNTPVILGMELPQSHWDWKCPNHLGTEILPMSLGYWDYPVILGLRLPSHLMIRIIPIILGLGYYPLPRLLGYWDYSGWFWDWDYLVIMRWGLPRSSRKWVHSNLVCVSVHPGLVWDLDFPGYLGSEGNKTLWISSITMTLNFLGSVGSNLLGTGWIQSSWYRLDPILLGIGWIQSYWDRWDPIFLGSVGSNLLGLDPIF